MIVLSGPARSLVALLGVAAVVGTVVCDVLVGARGGASFVAGLGIATGTVVAGTLLVDLAGRIAPGLALLAALGNYLLTVLLLVLLLGTVDDSVADVPSFVSGLVAAVVPYLVWQFRRARPPR